MSQNSKIEWTDSVWNPVRGCSIVSRGCKNCYAMKQAHRFSGPGGAYEGLTKMTRGGPVWTNGIRVVPDLLDQPLRWRKPRRIFVNSMSDLFHELVADEFIDKVFAVMALAPQHTFQVLTKRPERMREWFKQPRRRSAAAECVAELYCSDVGPEIARRWPFDEQRAIQVAEAWPPKNVWLGVSVERQKEADERIPLLCETPAAVRFLSCEPLLGPVNLGLRGVDWVIVGAESGSGARPMNLAWAQSIIERCKTAGVAVFMKQICDERGRKIPPHRWPPEFQIREYPD